MLNSKLIRLIKTFKAKELRLFKDYIESPFFNTNKEVIKLYDYIRSQSPTFNERKLRKEVVFKIVYPGKKYKEKEMNYVMSFLMKQAEDFVGYLEYQRDQQLTDFHKLQAYENRQLDKHYFHNLNKIKSKSNPPEKASLYDHYIKYRIADLENRHFGRLNIRKYDPNIEIADKQLDNFYFAKKLQYACEKLDRQQMLPIDYEFAFIDQIQKIIAEQDTDAGAIEVYNELFTAFSQNESERQFEQFLNKLNKNKECFSEKELKSLYYYALNYCIRKIRSGDKKYVQESLDLYLDGIQSKLLFEDGVLSPWTFKNIVKLFLRLNRFDDTKHFIKRNNIFIAQEFREDALNYNMADLNFYLKKFDDALEYLNAVTFSDVYYNLHGKVMLLKIFYETEKIEPLYSLVASFSQYIKRNKVIKKEVLLPYKNFVLILKKLQRTHKSDRKKILQLIEDTQFVTDRSWLIEKAAPN